jgi:hypothetical protein
LNRISILTGNYGSGKTEIALEMARRLAAKGRTALVDLDIVNPYFRSSTQRQALEALGVKVYAPNFAGTNLDLPSLPGEIIAVFEDPDVQVVFDVGGDATGAAALGRYHRYFEREGYELLYVVNACRPLSGTPEEIAGLLAQIEAKSQLKVSALINNTNLALETDADTLMAGQQEVEAVAQKLGLPIRCLAGMPQVLEALPQAVRQAYQGRLFAFSPVMRPDWLDE